MIRTLTITLATAALAAAMALPAAAQGVTPPSGPPHWRGAEPPVTNPHTFQDSEQTGRHGTAFGGQLHKLGRGIINTVTGPLEIPKRIAQVWRDTDPITGAVVGGIEGFGWAVGRSATGIYDILTFPIPVPDNYAPIMEPEFILPQLWGATVPGFAGDR